MRLENMKAGRKGNLNIATEVIYEKGKQNFFICLGFSVND